MLIQPKLGHYLLIACAILIELEKPQLSSFNCSLPFMSHTDGPQFFVQESGTTSGSCLRGFSVPSFSLFPDAYTRKNLAETPKTAASFVANSGVMGLTPCSMSETRT